MLIELLSGPAMLKKPNPILRYGSNNHERGWAYYLAQGFHISPAVGHDSHYPVWGDAPRARMGVYASELTEEEIYAALRANRTFATEDEDLRVDFRVNGAHMGSVLVLEEERSLEFAVSLDDPTEVDEEYEVTLLRGEVSPQHDGRIKKLNLADAVVARVSVGEGTTVIGTATASGRPEFFYVRVRQTGDGDRAWSAPIWVNHPRNYPLN